MTKFYNNNTLTSNFEESKELHHSSEVVETVSKEAAKNEGGQQSKSRNRKVAKKS